MKKTDALKIDNQHLRIDGKEAFSYEFPKHTWYFDTSYNVIKPIAHILYDRVPINWQLIDNLRNESMKNPILLNVDNWVWVGSQRMRALQWLYENEQVEQSILICKFTNDPLKLWRLWGGDEGKRCAAIQVQLLEILFKSMFYGVDKTIDGKNMYDFEVDGNKAHWKVRDINKAWMNDMTKWKK